ncbi:MAG: TonB-dependent receptor [Pseudomonadota bacterium]
MEKSISLMLAVSLTGLSAPILAQTDNTPDEIENILVIGSRLPTPAEQQGSAFSIISADILAQRQTRLASDVLRSVPGLAVSRNGNPGNLTQVRIRGAEANHTLVFIDGVEANDPVSASEFNFAHLLANDIERIEVLRGPQSALYGSDAIGGVINIITKQGEGGWQGNAFAEAGSFSTWEVGGALRGGNQRFNMALNAAAYQSDGYNISRSGDEDDGYENTTIGFKANFQPSEILKFQLSLRYTDSTAESDPQDFAFPATPTQGLSIDGDEEIDAEQFYGGLSGILALLDGRWTHRVNLSRTDTQSTFIQNGAFSSGNEGERFKFDYQTSLHLESGQNNHTLTFAFEHEDLDFANRGATPDALQNQDQSIDQNSVIGEYKLDINRQIFLSAGVRLDNNERFDDATTYRLTAAWKLPTNSTRLHASYGTGITNPSFFELFGFFPGSFIGNPNLEPEESQGFDIGIEQRFWNNRLTADITWFDQDLEKEITSTFNFTDFTSSVENQTGTSDRRGIEFSLGGKLTDTLSIQAAYTYTDAEDSNGERELRRPENIASLHLNYTFPNDRGYVHLGFDYNGEQEDSEFISATPENRAILDEYTLLNLSAGYKIMPNLMLFGRLENILDEDYEEVFSFRGAGFGVYAGLRFSFDSTL